MGTVFPADAVGIARFLVDGILLGEADIVDGLASFRLDTTSEPDGEVTLTVELFDIDGNLDAARPVLLGGPLKWRATPPRWAHRA